MPAQPAHILLVDDDALSRELLHTVLARAGYAVIDANSGAQALTQVTAQPPDLILLDVEMRGLSGYDVCKRLKANPATRDIRIIMLTGYESKEVRARAIAAGADAFFPKMDGWLPLLECIQSLLD